MQQLISAVEGSAIFALLRGLNLALWRLWKGSWLGWAVESVARWIGSSFFSSLFVGHEAAPSGIAPRLRRAVGEERPLGRVTRLEVFGIYFVSIFVPVELWLITRLPSEAKYLGDLVLVLLLLGLFIRMNRAGWPLRLTEADPPTVALLGIAALSTLWNLEPLSIAFFGTRAYLEYYAFYLVVAYLPWADSRRRTMLVWFLAVGVAIALLGDAQKFLHVATPRQWLSAAEAATTRSFGTMDNPNTFGGFLVWLLAMLLSLLFVPTRGGVRVLALIGAAVAAPALLFTLSREALLAWAAGALLIGLIADRRLLLLLLIGALALPIVDPHLISRFTYAFSQGYLSTSVSYGRLLFWERGLMAFLAHPLLGWGPGTFGGSVAHLYGSPVYVQYGLGFKPIIDSQHVQTLVELGLAGYIAYLWLGLAAVRAGLRLYRTDMEPFWRAVGLALAAGTVGLYLQSFFASLLETHQVIVFFWLIFGMVAWRLRNRAKSA